MANILVKKEDNKTYNVSVKESSSSTTHTVTMSHADYKRLSQNKWSEEAFIKKSFEFLLEREPKESILSKFNITVISEYFPEFEEAILKN